MARRTRTTLDALDRKLLTALNEDGRQSYRTLARGLKVSLTTVSARLQRLREQGIVTGFAPVIDASKVGYELAAAVAIRISRGRILQVQRKIASDERVFGVYDVTGDWDSLILARFLDRDDLDRFVKRLAGLEFIERTNTSVILNVVKEEPRVRV